MFGYMEPNFVVKGSKKQMSTEVDDGRYSIFELRETQQGNKYISRDRYSSTDKHMGNTLYIYKNWTLADHDWDKIWDGAEIDPKQFLHDERIEDHGTGYTRDGSICMY